MKDREYKRVMAFVKDGIRSGEFRVGSKNCQQNVKWQKHLVCHVHLSGKH